MPDEGGAKFLRNVCSYKSHTAEHPRIHHSSDTAVKTSNLTKSQIYLQLWKIRMKRWILMVIGKPFDGISTF
jgi:hypothetical protein